MKPNCFESAKEGVLKFNPKGQQRCKDIKEFKTNNALKCGLQNIGKGYYQ